MNLLNIEEPKNSKEKVCVGIDFGTTNSVCSVVIRKKINFIKDENDQIIIPTLIFYDNKKKNLETISFKVKVIFQFRL